MSDGPARYFRFAQAGDHYFAIIDTGPGQCRWQFLCDCHGLNPGEEWRIVAEWDTEGLLRMQIPRAPVYTEVPEHEVVRLLLAGGEGHGCG